MTYLSSYSQAMVNSDPNPGRRNEPSTSSPTPILATKLHQMGIQFTQTEWFLKIPSFCLRYLGFFSNSDMEQKLVGFLRSKKTPTSAKRSSLLLLTTKNVLSWVTLMVSKCLAHLWDFFTIANVNSTATVVQESLTTLKACLKKKIKKDTSLSPKLSICLRCILKSFWGWFFK